MKIAKSNFKIIGVFVIALMIMPLEANSIRIFSLSADDWARPRDGSTIPQFASVRSAVNYWESISNAALVIRYPGEDSGELWANELRDWLVSLGVPSDYISLTPGSQQADEIKLYIGTRDELDL